jgi:tripartite-type tricarboxylate transporter receptor subunit TctC
MANEALGTKFKMVAGYKGTAAGNLAMERGEVEGMFNIWEGMKSLNANWIREHKINLVVQFVASRHPELPDVPTIFEAARTDTQREVLRLFLSTGEIGRHVMTPPDVPVARVAAMREAFKAMLGDDDFRQDAARMKLELNPLGGVELQAAVDSVFATSPQAVATARKIMER